jgi:4-carboxymuconolactone decarboxylase
MRIRTIEPDEFDESLEPVLADILRLRGTVYNLHRVLAHSPKALRAFIGFSEYIRDNADLSPRLRELAVLRVATLHDVAYEIAQHLEPARRAGLTQEQITSVADWRQHADIFEARDRAVLEFVEETAKTFRVSDKTFSTIRQYLSESEMVDLALVVGWYLLCASVIVPFEIEPESLE